MRSVLIFSLLLVLIPVSIVSQIAQRPSPLTLYNNLSKEFPDFLSASEANRLEEKLEQFSNETSNQICVVIVDDLNGLETADYATKLINEWGIGKADKNNGAVILIKPTGGSGGRDLFIGVGYGLEGAIPDLATKRVRDEEMYPYLKNGENFTALDKATDRLMQLAKGEINVKDYTRARNGGKDRWWIYLVIFIFIMIIIRPFRGGGGGYTYGGGGRRYWGGGFGSFGGGSWGGGGGSGGGWGGFGGGHSGGGGSGGKW